MTLPSQAAFTLLANRPLISSPRQPVQISGPQSLGGWWLTGPPIITNPKAPKKCDEPREADEWASSPPLVGWEAVSPPAEHSSSILHLSRAPLHSFLFIPSPSSYFQQHKYHQRWRKHRLHNGFYELWNYPEPLKQIQGVFFHWASPKKN